MPRTKPDASRKVEAKRLKALREKLGLTQRDLAREFNTAPGAVGQWETGDRTIPGPVLKLIAIYEGGHVKPGQKI
jgi:DNA-binding transcriptional regulator YiaG